MGMLPLDVAKLLRELALLYQKSVLGINAYLDTHSCLLGFGFGTHLRGKTIQLLLAHVLTLFFPGFLNRLIVDLQRRNKLLDLMGQMWMCLELANIGLDDLSAAM